MKFIDIPEESQRQAINTVALNSGLPPSRELYRAVLEHRRKFIGLKGFDYDELYPATLCIVPKEEIAHQWEEDYQFMCEHMIYGETPSFTSLIENIKMLNGRIQQLNYQKHRRSN